MLMPLRHCYDILLHAMRYDVIYAENRATPPPLRHFSVTILLPPYDYFAYFDAVVTLRCCCRRETNGTGSNAYADYCLLPCHTLLH